MNTPQLTEIDEKKMREIVELLDVMTWMQEGVFTSPDKMKALFEHGVNMYAQDNESLKLYMEELWTRVEGNFTTTGKAVSWIAMQEAMIDELKKERNSLIEIGYESCEAEIMAEEHSAVIDTLLIECGCEEEQASIFYKNCMVVDLTPMHKS